MLTDEWLTPPDLLKRLGHFDLDPCCPVGMPWRTADVMFTNSGLELVWHGRVWMNPPYGRETGKWLDRLAQHRRGIGLTFARTETKMFFDYVWNRAHAVLFLRGRLTFCNLAGEPAKFNSGGPSCLIAYGRDDANVLWNVRDMGAYVEP